MTPIYFYTLNLEYGQHYIWIFIKNQDDLVGNQDPKWYSDQQDQCGGQ